MAGALSKRDIEMIFRAETDKATRPIGDLKNEVKQLRQALNDQIDAANKGEVSLDRLTDTTKKLKAAQDELGTARSLLTTLNNQVAALEKAEQKSADAAAKYAQLQKQVEAAEKPTKRLTNSMEAAGRAAEATAERESKLRAEVTQTREQIESIIGPVDNFQAAFRDIAESSKEVARGLAISGEAADQFKAKLAGVAAEEAKLAGDNAFAAQARDAGLLKSQIDYISQFENRVELLAQARRELNAQNAEFDRALSAQEAKVGAENVRRITAAFEEAAQEAQRLESVANFRQIAQNAQAAATDISRFGSTFDTQAASAQRLADAIQQIVQPGNAANQTIAGLEQSVTQAAAVLDGPGRRSLSEYTQAQNQLAAAGAAAIRQAADIDAYRQQQAALDASTAKFQQAQAEVLQLANALKQADAPTEEMARALKTAEAALETAGREMQRDNTILDQLSVKLRRAGVDTKNLAEADKRLTVAAKEAAAAQKEIGDKTGGKAGGGGLFGLSVQDAQNLSYQINDIITGLASGQPIFQILAQQSGQIWQIQGIQSMIVQFAKWIPLVAAAAAVVGTLWAALSRVNDQAERIRQNQGFLASLGDTNGATAEGLATVQRNLEDIGVSAEDARKATRNFVTEGLDPKFYQDFATAAKNASDVTGVDFVEASNLLTEAMKGGYDQVVALDDRFHFLTDAEKVQIQAMYDSGQASEAREMVFDRFYRKMGEGADNMNGPWSNAVNNFKAVFRSFLDWLGSTTVLQDFIRDTNNALIGLNYLLLRARGLSHEEAGRAAVSGGRMPTAPRTATGAPGRTDTTSAEGQRAIQDARRELDVRKRLTNEERLRNAEIAARRRAQSAGYTDQEVAELASLARQKEQNAINAEAATRNQRAARSAAAANRRAQNEAEALQNRIDRATESLHTALDRMNAQVARQAVGSLTDQLDNAVRAVDDQFARLYRQLDDFRNLAGANATIDGMTQAQYRAQLDTNKQILQNQARLGVYESNLNDLLNQRKNLLASIEEQAQSGQMSSDDAARAAAEVTSRLNPLINDLVASGRTFAQSIAGTTPSPALEEFISKLDRASAEANNAGPGGALASFGTTRLQAEEQKLNEIIQQRNALVEANNTLVELGLRTEADGRVIREQAYATSLPLIQEQINKTRELLDLLLQQGSITQQTYDTWIARLQAVNAQAQYVDERLQQIDRTARQAVMQGISTAFDSVAQSIAGVITGTKSLTDFFTDLGSAALNFAASFLKAMADVLVQIMAVQAVKSLFGASSFGGFFLGLHGGGTVGSYAGGQQRLGRRISLPDFSSIPRYHNGTQGVGLNDNERLAILETGEKVLTEEQQRREAASKARAADSGGGLRQVLAFGDDQVAAAMAGRSGEKVTVTHIRRNVPLLKQLLRD